MALLQTIDRVCRISLGEEALRWIQVNSSSVEICALEKGSGAERFVVLNAHELFLLPDGPFAVWVK
jgi:hypothetical protein